MTWHPWPYRPRTVFSPLIGFIRSIIYGVRNLTYWLPVIWSDRNHHHCFISIILSHKLADMANSVDSCGLSYGSSLRAKQMRECVCLLERMVSDAYDSGEEELEAGRSLANRYFKKQDKDILFLRMSEDYLDWWD